VRLALDSPFDPTDFGTFRRQETVLIVLNLGVLAALASMHVAFVTLIGPPPRSVLIAIAGRFVEQTLMLAWLQSRAEPMAPAHVRLWAHVSTWVGLGFGLLVISLGTFEDSHYPVLFVLPLLSAAFRFSMASAMAVTLLASAMTIGQVWVHGRARPQMAPGEYFESVTMALVYVVVTPVVAMLVAGLRQRERLVRQHVEELKRTRDQLVEEEKFAAVGRLASAVAHEVRNPVTMIVTSLSQATKPLAREDLRAELFDIANREAGRLERVTNDFLTYARPRSLQRRETTLSQCVGYVADLVRPEADGRSVTLTVDVPDEGHVSVDTFQVHQALLNLGTNAVQATAAGGGVRLTARRDGEIVVFGVENPGPAIPEDAIVRLFEPFFTTRQDGTGLGLSIARKIAEAHGGEIALAVNTASLVRFEIRLPIGAPAPLRGDGRIVQS
jgi:signal transduction histidine kinase